MTYRFLPIDPINISLAASVSSAFQLVNSSNGPKEYVINSTATTHIRRGFADVAAASATDLRIPANMYITLWLAPGEGVRAFSTAIATLQIGDTSL
jgi:hypothetical protein